MIDLSRLILPAIAGLGLYLALQLVWHGGRIALNMWAFRGTDWDEWARGDADEEQR